MKDKIKKLIMAHKILVAITIFAIVGGVYYFNRTGAGNAAGVSYVIGAVEKGAIIVSVSGTGQVSATNQVDLKPAVSAEILSINVTTGQTVKAGDLLATLDSKDLQTQVANAKNSLDSALASYNLKIADPTAQDLKLSENSVASAKLAYENSLTAQVTAKQAAEDNLAKYQRALDDAQRTYDNAITSQGLTADSKTTDLDNAYIGAKNTVSSDYISLRSSIITLDGILGMNNYNNPSNSYQSYLGLKNPAAISSAQSSYNNARNSLIAFENDYNSTGWTPAQTENLLNLAMTLAQNVRLAAQDTYNMLTYSILSTDLSSATLVSLEASASSAQSSAASNVSGLQSSKQTIASAKLSQDTSDLSVSGSIASAKSSLETAKSNLEQAIDDNKNNIASSDSDVKSKKLALENAQANYELKIAKPRDVDLAASRIQISQARTAYNTALENLSEAKITSPIDGVVAKIYQNPGDLSSISQSTPLITIVTNNQMATITLSEVDAVKVKTGQKAALTFSAVDGLEITGEVVEIDGVGTVTQGVVTYSVKISLDTQDSRIKPEMSVSASITTDEKLDVIMAPNAAIKTDASGQSYVEVLKSATEATTNAGIKSDEAPEIKTVEIGLANDSNTEIVTGLSESELIITKTISNSSSAAAGSSGGSSILGGGNMRVMTGGAGR